MLIPVKDEDALVKALTYLADNPEMAGKMGRQATKIREDYSEQKIADLWEAEMKKC